MVTMKVRNEDMVKAREVELRFPELFLSSLTAVNHVEFVTQVDDLRCSIVACGRQRRAAAKDMDVKLFHCS